MKPEEGFPSANDGSAPVDLRQLLDNLGSTVASLLVAPRGLEVAIGEPVIHDRVGGAPIESNAIVLAVGTLPDSSEAHDLIAAAGTAHASVIAF